MKTNNKNLTKKQEKLMKKLANSGPFIEGTLSTSYRICGGKGCACLRGKKHPAMFFTWKEDKVSKSLYVPVAKWKQAEQYNANYKNLKKIIREISDLQKILLRSKS